MWRVRQGPKGHFPEELHIALVELVQACLPEGTPVVLLGDGEFDGTTLQQTLQETWWFYACRTAQNPVATWEGETFRPIPWERVAGRGRSSSERR